MSLVILNLAKGYPYCIFQNEIGQSNDVNLNHNSIVIDHE